MDTQAIASNATAGGLPIILLLSLNKEGYWDEMHSTLVDTISSKATIKRVTKAASAVTYLTNNSPSAVIITDAALTKSGAGLDAIRLAVVNYVRNGGIAVMATQFSTFVTPPDLKRWFSETWGLSWTYGDYHRTTVHLRSDACEGRFGRLGLPPQYSQKAVFLANVDRNAVLYQPSNTSRTQSHVFAPAPVIEQQTPVAFTRVGEGWLGYIGDVNNEAESQSVLVAMCGL